MEGSYHEQELAELKNLVSALFRLEHSQGPESALQLIGHLNDWLQTPETNDLRRSFVIWIKRVLLRDRMGDPDYETVQDLVEVHTMLEKRVKQWQKQWMLEGKLEGLTEGELRGKLEGERKAKLETARGLILHGVQLDIIAASTGLSREELEKLRRDMES